MLNFIFSPKADCGIRKAFVAELHHDSFPARYAQFLGVHVDGEIDTTRSRNFSSPFPRFGLYVVKKYLATSFTPLITSHDTFLIPEGEFPRMKGFSRSELDARK